VHSQSSYRQPQYHSRFTQHAPTHPQAVLSHRRALRTARVCCASQQNQRCRRDRSARRTRHTRRSRCADLPRSRFFDYATLGADAAAAAAAATLATFGGVARAAFVAAGAAAGAQRAHRQPVRPPLTERQRDGRSPAHRAGCQSSSRLRLAVRALSVKGYDTAGRGADSTCRAVSRVPKQHDDPEWMRRQRQSRIWLAWCHLNRRLSVRRPQLSPNPTTSINPTSSECGDPHPHTPSLRWSGVGCRSNSTRLRLSHKVAVKCTLLVPSEKRSRGQSSPSEPPRGDEQLLNAAGRW
jgi:hypothetical protein